MGRMGELTGGNLCWARPVGAGAEAGSMREAWLDLREQIYPGWCL